MGGNDQQQSAYGATKERYFHFESIRCERLQWVSSNLSAVYHLGSWFRPIEDIETSDVGRSGVEYGDLLANVFHQQSGHLVHERDIDGVGRFVIEGADSVIKLEKLSSFLSVHEVN